MCYSIIFKLLSFYDQNYGNNMIKENVYPKIKILSLFTCNLFAVIHKSVTWVWVIDYRTFIFEWTVSLYRLSISFSSKNSSRPLQILPRCLVSRFEVKVNSSHIHVFLCFMYFFFICILSKIWPFVVELFSSPGTRTSMVCHFHSRWPTSSSRPSSEKPQQYHVF